MLLHKGSMYLLDLNLPKTEAWKPVTKIPGAALGIVGPQLAIIFAKFCK